jgi:hypothetical protein
LPPGKSHRFIDVLPVIDDVDLADFFGDGLEELNAHIIAPSFKTVPWYADHDSDPERRYESFLVNDLVPWVQANLSVTGQEEHWLIGLSKSGFERSRFAPSRRVPPASRSIGMGAHHSRTTTPTTSSPDGQPGIGLYATTIISLDDWQGGTLTTNP